MIKMYRHEFDGRDSSGRLLQPSFYITLMKRCSRCIGLLNVTCYRHKERYELHPDYRDGDCHRRNYLVFCCGRGDQG
jgi:hypothetical protein